MWHDIKFLNFITKLILYLLFSILLFFAFEWLTKHSFFNLKKILINDTKINQLQNVDENNLKKIVLPNLKGNYFSADLSHTKKVFEKVPWVKNASIRRSWPDKLIVSINEYKALGIWGKLGDKLLSTDGNIFDINNEEFFLDNNLPYLSGPEGTNFLVADRLKLLKKLFEKIDLSIFSLNLSDRYSWKIELSNSLVVNLGRVSDYTDFKKKVSRFIDTYPYLFEKWSNKIETVDLRYPNGLAVSLKKTKINFVKKSSENSF